MDAAGSLWMWRQTVLNKARLVLTLVLVGFLAGSMAACTSSRTSESTGEYVDDSVISNKVRGQLLGDKDLNITQIDIETYKGVVQLSGFVDTPEAKNRAGTVAASVSGVKQVRNNIIVKVARDALRAQARPPAWPPGKQTDRGRL